ncbi:MAG: hypothetical protein HY809_08915 [Nitrospirae bacterium]|nr:hypothetical protein [Nitrospirota bacterium]
MILLRIISIAICLFIYGISYADNSDWLPLSIEQEYDKDDNQIGATIKFNNGRQIKSELMELKYIGTISDIGSTPHFIFSGRSCIDCDMNTSLYVHNPNNGDLKGDNLRNAYPGKLFYYLDDQLVKEIRFFYGNCLPNYNQAAVWYIKYLQHVEWKQKVYITEVTGTSTNDIILRENIPDINIILNQVKSELCKELPGIDMQSEP